jgi:hypothetical protein
MRDFNALRSRLLVLRQRHRALTFTAGYVDASQHSKRRSVRQECGYQAPPICRAAGSKPPQFFNGSFRVGSVEKQTLVRRDKDRIIWWRAAAYMHCQSCSPIGHAERMPLTVSRRMPVLRASIGVVFAALPRVGFVLLPPGSLNIISGC